MYIQWSHSTLSNIELGGAMLTPESISSPDAVRTLTGSTLIYSAPSLEEVRKLVESDVYYTAGVVRKLNTPLWLYLFIGPVVGSREACHHTVRGSDTLSMKLSTL